MMCKAKALGLRYNNAGIFSEDDKSTFSCSFMNNSKDSFTYRILPDYFRHINSTDLSNLSIKQKLGLWFLKLIMRKEDEGLKDLPTNEFIHESVVRRYAGKENEMPVNLRVIYKDMVDKKRVIDFV